MLSLLFLLPSLALAAPKPIAFVQKFRSEFEAHLAGKPCPYDPHADAMLVGH